MPPAAKRRPNSRLLGRPISKDGYPFDPSDDSWKLNKDVQVSAFLPRSVDESTRAGFRATLQRYAEEASARHTENMATRFRRYLRDTGATRLTVPDLLDWRAVLGETNQWYLGGLKGFLLAWHEYGFEGICQDVVGLLKEWRIQGNEKGRAVLSGCPESGPFTDLELAALFDWANAAVAQNAIDFEDYAYLLTLAMTARRSVQIAALRGKDLTRVGADGGQFRLNFPRAKQRGMGFRQSFRPLAINEDLFLVLRHQHERSIAATEAALRLKLSETVRGEVPIFLNSGALRGVSNEVKLWNVLTGSMADSLHATTDELQASLRRCARSSRARSERTGDFLRLSATRFRYTRGTKLRREGFGATVIAELLDHSDTQNVKVYTENTAQEAVIIDQVIGARLAPFAQACLGQLVRSEREAIRGDDPRSRVPNQKQNAVGTCGTYGFCNLGYRFCYTCRHFQPWVDGPHQELLDGLYEEKEQARVGGAAAEVVNANDRLILAVEHCVQLCKEAKAHTRQLESPGD